MPNNFDNHFKDLFENTSDLIHFVNLDGSIQLVNPAWLKSLKYQLHEVINKDIYAFIHPPCIGEYKISRSIAIENNKRVDIVTTFITKHGEQVVVEGQIGCSSENDKVINTQLNSRRAEIEELKEKEKKLRSELIEVNIIIMNSLLLIHILSYKDYQLF